MPANLTPEYYEAERDYKAAVTSAEKLQALQRMLSVIPKHKGTDKMQGDLKKRLSKLKLEVQSKKRSRRTDVFSVPKEGSGQASLAGAPNCGKSSLLAALTGAHPKIGNYAFTTSRPLPGMMPYKDIWVQIVDLPPLSPDFSAPWVMAVIRQSDLALFVIDFSTNPLVQYDDTLAFLKQNRTLFSENVQRDEKYTEGGVQVPAMLVGAKMDSPGAEENAEIFMELVNPKLPVLYVSAETRLGLDDLAHAIFKKLSILRVYTKIPGKPPDMGQPFVLPLGASVSDLAKSIHRDFTQTLRFARIWGEGRQNGQRVSRDDLLRDGDVVEIHA